MSAKPEDLYEGYLNYKDPRFLSVFFGIINISTFKDILIEEEILQERLSHHCHADVTKRCVMPTRFPSPSFFEII